MVDSDMIGGVSVTVLMLLCVVCNNMGGCYMKLSQFDTAEEAFSQALTIYSTLLPQGHHNISNSGTTVLRQLF